MTQQTHITAAAKQFITGTFVLALITFGSVTTASADEENTTKLAGFSKIIGAWVPPEAFLKENEWANDYYSELFEWNGKDNFIRIRELALKEDVTRNVFEGFVYWHPVEDKIKFSGYNRNANFYFEGAYTLTDTQVSRTMNVYYPDDFVFKTYPEQTARVRTFRSTRTFTDDNIVALETFLKVGGAWKKWPTEDAKPFILERVIEATAT